jgi:hypothetical protein
MSLAFAAAPLVQPVADKAITLFAQLSEPWVGNSMPSTHATVHPFCVLMSFGSISCGELCYPAAVSVRVDWQSSIKSSTCVQLGDAWRFCLTHIVSVLAA